MPNPDVRAVFLDRDGTIIYDAGYPKDPRQVVLLPGAGEALAELRRHGFRLVIIGNQSGVGRGLVTNEEAARVHQRVLSKLAACGVQLDAAYYCFHAPEEHCRCRKPSPGMLLQAARDLGIDLTRSYMVGDKLSDVRSGRSAGCKTVLLRTARSRDELHLDPAPSLVAANWTQVLNYILNCNQVAG